MRLKFFANNLDWNAKPELEKVEREFEKSKIRLQITQQKIDIPIEWDTTWGSPVYTKDEWFFKNITSKASGYKIAVLGIQNYLPKQGGTNKPLYNGIHNIELKVGKKGQKVKSRKGWLVHVLSHEISHALFHMERMQLGLYQKLDQTHNYLHNSNPKFQLKECLSHLDPRFIKSIK